MNSQYFSAEQIKHGEMQKLLDFLLSEAYGAGDHYNDIHIYPTDLNAFVVEWEQIPWSHDYGGSFKYIDEEHVVMLEARYPDGSYGLFHDEDEYEEELASWLNENPGWKKNQFGHWYNEAEEAKMYENLFDDEDSGNPLSGLEENGMPQ